MKKFISISLACLYLLVSSGLMLEIHHCMGRVADSDVHYFSSNELKECGKCGMEKGTDGKHCCSDEYKQVKVSDDQKPAALVFQLQAPEMTILPGILSHDLSSFVTTFNRPQELRVPPPLPAVSTPFLGVFRI